MTQEQLNKLHTAQVEILDDFVRICKKYNLRYCLVGGTLLGAVRHKGFIPWDDDIDISMPRADFQKFSQVAPFEQGDAFYYQYHNTDKNYGLNFAKYCKANTAFEEIKGTKQGIYIDIFALDYAISPEDTEKSFRTKMFRIVDALIYMRKFGVEGRPFHTKLIYIISCLFPLRFFVKIENKIMTMIPPEKAKCYIPWGTRYSLSKETIEISRYEPFNRLEFEGKLYNVIRDYDYYLTRVYGDYMQLPPPDKRITHNPKRLSFNLNGNDEIL